MKLTFLVVFPQYIGFNINGLYTVNVEVKGSGHECQIGLANVNQFNYGIDTIKVCLDVCICLWLYVGFGT